MLEIKGLANRLKAAGVIKDIPKSTGSIAKSNTAPAGATTTTTAKKPSGYTRLTADDVRSMKLKKGGSVSSASKRADGCAQRGKTRGKIV